MGFLPYFHTWCGLSANLECRSETCCTRFAENTGCKKLPSRHHRTTLSGCICATKACIENRKKNLLNSSISSTCAHNMANFGPLAAEISLPVLGTPGIFQWVSRLGSITARHFSSGHQPNCGVEQRVPPIFGRAAIALGIGPHF